LNSECAAAADGIQRWGMGISPANAIARRRTQPIAMQLRQAGLREPYREGFEINFICT